MLNRFRKVSNELYRSSAPTPDDVIWLHKKIGIERIISLDELSANRIKLVCELLKIEHITLPIDYTKSSLIKFLLNIEELFNSDKKTLIHCHFGRDRTGLAVAIYRCKIDGWSAEKAIKEAHSLDFCSELPKEIEKLYISIIKDSCGKINDDVNNSFDSFITDRGITSYPYPGGISDSLSWAPISNYRNFSDGRSIDFDGVNVFPNEFLNPELDINDQGHSIPASGELDGINQGIAGAAFSLPIPLTTP